MERDVGWKGYLSDDERYADVINGIACGGRQVVKKSDLQEMIDYSIPLRNMSYDVGVYEKQAAKIRKAVRKELMERDAYYQNMEEDAFDVVVQYANATELVGLKDYYRKDGKVDMCKAITEWLADEREAGMQAGMKVGSEETKIIIVTNMLKRGMPDADIRALAECEQELIDEVRNQLIL